MHLAPLYKVANYIEEKFSLFQISESVFDFRSIEELNDKRIKKHRWLAKIQEGVSDPDEVESVKYEKP